MEIPTEDFADVTLVISDAYGDDVRGGNGFDGHGDGAIWWLNNASGAMGKFIINTSGEIITFW